MYSSSSSIRVRVSGEPLRLPGPLRAAGLSGVSAQWALYTCHWAPVKVYDESSRGCQSYRFWGQCSSRLSEGELCPSPHLACVHVATNHPTISRSHSP